MHNNEIPTDFGVYYDIVQPIVLSTKNWGDF